MTEKSLDGVPRCGDVLGGKYAIERLIAQGGMGVVLEARHLRLGHGVAIKVLQPEARAIPEIAQRFEREARAAAQIRSANVARVIDVEVLPDGSPYMVMELLEGHDLGVELERRRTIPALEAVELARAACVAMAEAHRLGIVHRDLKPSNLFLALEGTRRTLKVLDFGISKITTELDSRMTATNSVLGTPLYMSPEQVRSAKNVDARTDIWSLGVILYEMLSGEVPFLGESATAIAAAIVADDVIPIASRCEGLPEGVAEVVMKALAKKPEGRYQTIEELAAALDALLPAEEAPRGRASAASLPSIPVRIAPPASLGPARTSVPAIQVSPDARTLAADEVGREARRTATGWTDARPATSAAVAEAPSSKRALAFGLVAAAALLAVIGGTVMARSGSSGRDAVAAPPIAATATSPSTALVADARLSDPPPPVVPAATPEPPSAPSTTASGSSSASPPPAPLKTARPTAPPAKTVAPAAPPPRPPPVGLPTHI